MDRIGSELRGTAEGFSRSLTPIEGYLLWTLNPHHAFPLFCFSRDAPLSLALTKQYAPTALIPLKVGKKTTCMPSFIRYCTLNLDLSCSFSCYPSIYHSLVVSEAPPCDPAKMRRIPIRHLAGWLFPGTKDMERSRTGGEGENKGEQRLLSAPRGATSHWRHRVWVRVCAREIEGGRNGCLRACLRLAEVPEGSWPHGKIGKEVLYHLWTLS